ncbi:MAG: hypothetical protein WCG63_09545 [Opitutaceae bacterium]
MKKIIAALIAGLAVGAVATWFALHQGGAEPIKAEAPAGAASKPKENPLKFNTAKRTAAGIALIQPESLAVAPELSAFGRVLDASSFLTLVAEVESAKIAALASQKAAIRARELFTAGANASAQAVETAEAVAAKDAAAVTSARSRLLAGWGRKLAESGLAKVAAGLEAGASLVRLDLLPGEVPATDLKKAKICLAGADEWVNAEILGPAPVADTQLQGISLIASVAGHALPVGAALRATLPGPGGTTNAVILPRSAVVYHQGSPWIFVLGEEDTFERKLVTLGRTLGSRVVITSGLEQTEQIASSGAGQLLSAELQAGGATEP